MSNPTLFNTTKTVEDYAQKKLFGVGDSPLLDTVHDHFPKISQLYDEMCALKWKETEIDFSQCLIDFEFAPPDMSEMMIKTLSWQWHNDSLASQAPTTIIAPFEPCTEIWKTEVEIQSNELTHGLTYSEIVRMSFKDPDKVLASILEQQEVYQRSGAVGRYLRAIKTFSINYAYAKENNLELPSEKEVCRHLILFYFIMLCLERIQFMASFAITFTIVSAGYFIPIGSAVMKICQDEFEVHSEYRKETLRELFKTAEGAILFEEMQSTFVEIIEEVVDQDTEWTTDYIFEKGAKSLVGTNASLVSAFILYCTKDVANLVKVKTKYSFPRTNPMPHLDDFMDLS